MTDWIIPGEAGAEAHGDTELVGREHEMEVLLQAVADSAIVVLQGDAGIGKSHLIREFLQRCRRELQAGRLTSHPPGPAAWPLILAQCRPHADDVPFDTIAEILREIGSDNLNRLGLKDISGTLGVVVPEWGGHGSESSSTSRETRDRQQVLNRALDELLRGLGSRALVIEDAHWADAPTLDYLIRRWRDGLGSGALIFTCRPGEIPPYSPLHLLARPGAAEESVALTLKPLSLAEVSAQLRQLLNGASSSSNFTQFIHRSTDGNPLRVEETVRLMSERGELVNSDGVWMRHGLGDTNMPALDASVLERVNRLSEEARQILTAAAVFRQPADQATLYALTGLNEAEFASALRAALTSGLLVVTADRLYKSNHAVPGDIIYQTTEPALRRILHRRSASVLAQWNPVPASELTWHYRHAGDIANWSACMEASAERANATGATLAAVKLLLDVLGTADLPAAAAVRVGVQLARMTAKEYSSTGRLPSGVTDALRALLDSASLDDIQRETVRCEFELMLNLSDADQGWREIWHAARALGSKAAPAVEAMITLCRPWNCKRPISVRRECLAEALVLLPRLEDKTTRIALEIESIIPRLELGVDMTWTAAEARFRQLRKRLLTDTQKKLLGCNYGYLALLGILWGRPQRVNIWLEQAGQLVREASHESFLHNIRVTYLLLNYLTGRWSGLEDALVALPELDRRGRLEGGGACIKGAFALAKGEIEKGERILEQALKDCDDPGLFHIRIVIHTELGRLRLDNGQPARALQYTSASLRRIKRTGYSPWAADLMPVHIAALARTGAVAEIGPLIRTFEDDLAGHDAPAATAALTLCRAHHNAALGDHRLAAEQFAQAAVQWAAIQRKRHQLLAMEEQAICLEALTEPEQAYELLTTVEKGLAALGAWRDLARVQTRVTASRRPSDPEPSTGDLRYSHPADQADVPEEQKKIRGSRLDLLTDRECDFARLAASGHTNAEIARKLGVGTTTVVNQLTRIISKLGVITRAEMVAQVVESGLPAHNKGNNNNGNGISEPPSTFRPEKAEDKDTCAVTA